MGLLSCALRPSGPTLGRPCCSSRSSLGDVVPMVPDLVKFFLLLVDDFSHYMWVSLLGSKDSTTTTVKHIQAAAERKSGNLLGALRTDRGDEFTATHFKEYCAELRMRHEMAGPYTPQ
jgi:transposase InsO family protein